MNHVRRMRGSIAAWAVLGSITLFASSAFAQAGTAVLTGKIVDASTKQPVADAVVTVTSPSLQGEQLMVTDAAGVYRIPGLPPGEYTIHLDKETYKPYSRSGIALRADTTIQVSAEVLPEAIKEEIVVVGDPPTVDIGSTTTGTNVSSEFTRRVPVSQPGTKGSVVRSFESAAEIAPGARFDDYGTSINGTTSPENQYVIDGVSVNDPAFGINGTPLSLEFIQETNVITGGYMPEYGRTTGGFLNVVTKQGSNDLRGTIFGYFSPGFLQAERKKAQREGSTITTDIELRYQWDAGFDIGGPIIKDKLWFYAGFDYFVTKWKLERNLNRFLLEPDPNSPGGFRNVVDPSTGFSKTVRIPGTRKFFDASENGFQYIGKLSYAINRDNRVALEIFGMPRFSGGEEKFGINPRRDSIDDLDVYDRNIQGPVGTMGHTFDSFVNDVVLKYQTAFENKHTLLDSSIGWHHQDGGRFPIDDSAIGGNSGLASFQHTQWILPHNITDFESIPNPSQCDPITADPDPNQTGEPGEGTANPCPVTKYFSGGPESIFDTRADRYQANVTVTKLLRAAGHHVIKAGVDAEHTTYRINNAYSGGRRYLQGDYDFYFGDREWGFLTGPDTPVSQNALEFRAKSYTVGGFLQDSWSILDQVTLNAGLRYDVQLLYNDAGDLSMVIPNQWSPRIGAIYDFMRNGRSKVYGHYARYYESVPLDIAQRALSGDSLLFTGTAGPLYGGTCNPLDYNSARTDCLNSLAPWQGFFGNYYLPSQTFRQIGGGRTPVDPDLKAQSSDEFILGAEYEVIPSGRLGLSYTHRYMNHVIEDMSRTETATYFIGNPGEGIASDFPKATRDYDAVSLYFEKNWKRQWLAQGSYTISYLRGNYSGLYKPGDTLQLDPNMNSTFDLQSLLANGDGALPGDRRHQLKLFGAKEFSLPRGMSITAGLGYRSRSGEPTNYFGRHAIAGPKEVMILPRGSGERTPWVHSIDPHIGYAIDVTKRNRFEIAVDVFNVFNFQAVTRVDEAFTDTPVAPIPGGSTGDLAGCSGTGRCLLTNLDGTRVDPSAVNRNFGKPIAYQEPLTVRFGARLTF